MQYALIATHKTNCDGKNFEAGDPIAQLDSAVDAGQLNSLIDARMVRVVLLTDLDTIEPTPVESQANDSQEQPEPQADLPPVAATDSPSTVESDVEQLAAMQFPGLKTRIAVALLSQSDPALKIEDAEALRAFVDRGGDLIDLDDIGIAAKKAVLDWLEENLPASTPAGSDETDTDLDEPEVT